jgi:hypothetical protein
MSRIDGIRELASTDRGGLKNILALMFLLPIYEFFRSSADAVQAIFNVPISMLTALADAFGGLIQAIFGGSANIINAGAMESTRSLTQGIWAQFGPFTFTVAVAVVLLTAYMVTMYAKEEETGDLPIPYSTTDIPLIGSDEDGGD